MTNDGVAETGLTQDEDTALPRRSVPGSSWRGAVTLVVACTLFGAGAWVDSRFRMDGVVATLPSMIVALVVYVIVILWLRAGQQGWSLAVALSCGFGGALAGNLIGDGAFAGGRLQRDALTASTWNQASAVMTAASVALMAVSIVCATVKGHQDPVVGNDASRGTSA
ncbi:hypothetical protein [Streptomyces sp. NPDC001530]|uniref:hypothetical protein n=1 Tax=Streptomyces sp. NPDC001530 TaxID=3364582 RepID=UPI0036914DFB